MTGRGRASDGKRTPVTKGPRKSVEKKRLEEEEPKKREQKSSKDGVSCSRGENVGEKEQRTGKEKPKSKKQETPHRSTDKPAVSRGKSEEEKSLKPKLVADGRRTKSLDCSNEKEVADSKKQSKSCTTAKCPKPETKKGDKDKILIMTLDKLKINKVEKAMAARIINQTITSIIDHLQKTKCFADVKSLPTGSYYENLKIIHPDEFDVMITIPVRVGLEVESLDEDGAFYIVKLKRGTPTLDSFQQDGTLSANKILNEFREEVKKSVKSLRTVKLERKKKGCPAVTLSVTAAGQDPISLDVVFGLEVRSSWPPFTNEGFKIENWLGTKVKQAFKRKPYYLVPKYEGIGTRELEGGLAKDGWRISFSHVEKEMIKNHGSEKTCCEAGGTHCCRKDCLKLLKHLLGLLKNKDTSLSKFCSYHAKTTFLHACSSRAKDSKWDASSLGDCFQTLLGDFESYLKDGTLPNFFIPTQNLLSGNSQKSRDTLLKHLENERANGFPIFS